MKRTSRLEKKLVKAIDKLCIECIYDPCTGNWREQVERCPSPKFPLYTHLPTTEERTI